MAMTRASRNVGLRDRGDASTGALNAPRSNPQPVAADTYLPSNMSPYGRAAAGVYPPSNLDPIPSSTPSGPRPPRRLKASVTAAAARAPSRAMSRRPRLTNRAAGSCRRLCLPLVQAASGASCPAPSSPPSSPAQQLQLPQQLLLARRSRTPSPPSPRPTRTRQTATARRWGRSISRGSWAGCSAAGAGSPASASTPASARGCRWRGARRRQAAPDMSGIAFDQNGNPV